jgi:hypothetical protein
LIDFRIIDKSNQDKNIIFSKSTARGGTHSTRIFNTDRLMSIDNNQYHPTDRVNYPLTSDTKRPITEFSARSARMAHTSPARQHPNRLKPHFENYYIKPSYDDYRDFEPYHDNLQQNYKDYSNMKQKYETLVDEEDYLISQDSKMRLKELQEKELSIMNASNYIEPDVLRDLKRMIQQEKEKVYRSVLTPFRTPQMTNINNHHNQHCP